jgi:hypothetical protein
MGEAICGGEHARSANRRFSTKGANRKPGARRNLLAASGGVSPGRPKFSRPPALDRPGMGPPSPLPPPKAPAAKARSLEVHSRSLSRATADSQPWHSTILRGEARRSTQRIKGYAPRQARKLHRQGKKKAFRAGTLPFFHDPLRDQQTARTIIIMFSNGNSELIPDEWSMQTGVPSHTNRHH